MADWLVEDGIGEERAILLAGDRVLAAQVRFKRLSAQEIDDYIASGEWHGKAGGYAIQGRAEGLIAWIGGSHSGVVGLPLFETRALLKSAGFSLG